MSDTQQLVDVLKQLLKARQLTYADLALRLGLSHASVKRLFSTQTFTLARLAQVCRVLEIDFFDLARLARGRTDSTREMSERQETALAQDAKLLGVFYLLLSDWSAQDILDAYDMRETDLVRLLVRLDRLQLIELLPKNRVRMRTPKLVQLRPGGPIHRVHGKRVVDEFVAAQFDRVGGLFRFECRELSKASYALMQRRLERLAAEFLELAELDASLPSKRRETIGVLFAMRPWALSLVTGLKARSAPRSAT